MNVLNWNKLIEIDPLVTSDKDFNFENWICIAIAFQVIGRRNMTADGRMKFNLGRLQNLGIGYIIGYITCEICINPKSDVGYYIIQRKVILPILNSLPDWNGDSGGFEVILFYNQIPRKQGKYIFYEFNLDFAFAKLIRKVNR